MRHQKNNISYQSMLFESSAKERWRTGCMRHQKILSPHNPLPFNQIISLQ